MREPKVFGVAEPYHHRNHLTRWRPDWRNENEKENETTEIVWLWGECEMSLTYRFVAGGRRWFVGLQAVTIVQLTFNTSLWWVIGDNNWKGRNGKRQLIGFVLKWNGLGAMIGGMGRNWNGYLPTSSEMTSTFWDGLLGVSKHSDCGSCVLHEPSLCNWISLVEPGSWAEDRTPWK